MNKNIMKNLEYFGDLYCEQHLEKLDKKRLSEDWWYALKFFFSKSFMRGRKDKLSVEYCSFTIETLESHFEIRKNPKEAIKKLIESKEQKHLGAGIVKNFKKKENFKKKNCVKNDTFKNDFVKKHSLIEKLITPQEVIVKVDCLQDGESYQKKIYLGNEADLMMVLDTLCFVCDIPENNIYLYIKNLLKLNEIEKVDNEIKTISYMGDKLTTFLIRDIILLNSDIELEDYRFAFPVDTWVSKLSKKLDNEDEGVENVKEFFIKEAKESGNNPLKIAAGLWYMGANSLDILIKYIDDKVLEEVSKK